MRRLVARIVCSWLYGECALPLEWCSGFMYVALRAGYQLALSVALCLYGLERRDYMRGMFRRTRSSQMEARMVAADTPCRAVVAGLCACIMELCAQLVPKLVASTLSNGGIAVVAGPAGKRWSCRWFACSTGRWRLGYESRGWVC